MLETLFVLCVVNFAAADVPGFNDPILASQSDYGILTLHNSVTDNAYDASIYFVDDLAMTNKVHVIIGITDCICVGFSDIEKINQMDYLANMDYLFSFGVYVSYNIPYRAKCGRTREEVQKLTSLAFNSVGSGVPFPGFHQNIIWPIPLHKPSDDWIEGPMMYAGMRDFRNHSWVVNNQKTIYETDKSGGFLYLQGTVFMRPCLLWPWYIPWILDSYGTDGHTINILPPFTTTPYLNSTDAELFYETTAILKDKGVITDKHLANLKDNNNNYPHRARVFHFQAVFIPHRFAGEFLTLLEGYKDTTLSSSVYIPFIFQLLWDSNSWSQFGPNRNNTIYASPQPLLKTCQSPTIEDSMNEINTELVQQLTYFAYGWCGWWSPITKIEYIIKDEIQYIVKTSKKYVYYHLYEVVFFITVSVVGLCILLAFRRRIYDGYLWAKHRCAGFKQLKVPTAYVPHHSTTDGDGKLHPAYKMSALGDDDDEDKINAIDV
jgi:hypothetical protein